MIECIQMYGCVACRTSLFVFFRRLSFPAASDRTRDCARRLVRDTIGFIDVVKEHVILHASPRTHSLVHSCFCILNLMMGGRPLCTCHQLLCMSTPLSCTLPCTCMPQRHHLMLMMAQAGHTCHGHPTGLHRNSKATDQHAVLTNGLLSHAHRR